MAACATFTCEAAAQEQAVPLQAVAVTAAGGFDSHGMCGEDVAPRLQAFQARCPVYTTLSQAVPTELDVVLEPAPATDGKGRKMKVISGLKSRV